MAFKHSLSIMSARFSTVYKLFLFLLVLAIVAAGVSVGVLLPTLSGFIDQVEELQVLKSIGDYAKTIFGDQPEAQEAAYAHLVEVYDAFLGIIDGNSLMINVAIVLAILLYFVFILFMHNYMSSNSKFGFASNLVVNFVRAMRYASLYTLLSLVYYAFGVFIVWLLFLTVYKGSAFVGCMMTLLVFFVLTAIRSSLFAGWAPAMVADDMTARAALAESCKMAKERFGMLMSWYFAYYVLVFAATILLGVATFGIGSVFVLIVALLHTRIFDMVVYYRYKGRRYYVDVFNVIDPTIKQRTI